MARDNRKQNKALLDIISDKPTEYPILSEVVEPVCAYIVGRLYAQLKEAKETKNCFKIRDACQHLWFAVNSMSSLSCSCNAPHFSLAISNLRGKIADIVQDEMGIDPFVEWK